MAQEFLNRALPIFTESGSQTLRNKVVAFREDMMTRQIPEVVSGALSRQRCSIRKTENRGQTPILPPTTLLNGSINPIMGGSFKVIINIDKVRSGGYR